MKGDSKAFVLYPAGGLQPFLKRAGLVLFFLNNIFGIDRPADHSISGMFDVFKIFYVVGFCFKFQQPVGAVVKEINQLYRVKADVVQAQAVCLLPCADANVIPGVIFF